MKKLIILAAAIAASVAANAASINWGASAVKQSTIEGSGLVANGYSAYFFIVTNTVTLDNVTASLSAGDTSVIGLATFSKDGTYAAATQAQNILQNGVGSYDEGTTVSAFTIILDTTVANAANATSYLVAQNASGEKVISKTAAKSAMAFGMGTQASNTNWQSIPEPTSGLLLLIGMAGLALKRKQA